MDMKVSGSGSIPGGEYENVRISGSGKCHGNIKCISFHASGSAHCAGSVECTEEFHVSGSGHIISSYLEFFSGAGHDRNNEDVLRLISHFFCPISLDERAAHLLGRLAGGEVLNHIGIIKLTELDPSGRA